MKITPKLILVVAVLPPVLAIAVYGLTAIFTQTVPSANVKGPNGNSIATAH